MKLFDTETLVSSLLSEINFYIVKIICSPGFWRRVDSSADANLSEGAYCFYLEG
jgi:hypothetical protein